jgi:hypothetical protein
MYPGELFPAAQAALERVGAELAEVVAVVPGGAGELGPALGRLPKRVPVERAGERVSHRVRSSAGGMILWL